MKSLLCKVLLVVYLFPAVGFGQVYSHADQTRRAGTAACCLDQR